MGQKEKKKLLISRFPANKLESHFAEKSMNTEPRIGGGLHMNHKKEKKCKTPKSIPYCNSGKHQQHLCFSNLLGHLAVLEPARASI